VVDILPGTVVTYDSTSNARLNTVEVEAGGRLLFRTDVDTHLRVGNFDVLQGGRLEVGTPDHPVAPDVRADIVIADQPLDLAVDPSQYGTSLLGFGKVTLSGSPLSSTFERLAVEPHAGDTTLTLADPVTGWRAGDKLVIPPSGDPLAYADTSATEELTVRSVSGNTVQLASPLRGVHLGARDGDGHLDFLPHVADLTRNVVVRSENPNGTRGHTQFMDRAEVDLRYVAFKDLGRTTADPLDSTTYDEMGNVTHYGTNQIARYALHLHHVMGALNPANEGYQYQLIGNAIDGGRKWGMTIHDSHYGLIQDNVVYNLQAAGIVTESGSESYNMFEHNFTLHIPGGNGFWFNGTNNSWCDNVAADTGDIRFGSDTNFGSGFYGQRNIFYNDAPVDLPRFRGADMRDPLQVKTVWMSSTTFQEFEGNEAYSVGVGLWLDHRNGISGVGHTVENFSAWSTYGFSKAVLAYGTSGVTLDGLVARGASVWVQSNFGPFVVRNSDIQGADVGIDDQRDFGDLVVENTYLRNDADVVLRMSQSIGGTGPIEDTVAPLKTTTLRGVTFDAPAGLPLSAISLSYQFNGVDSWVPVLGNIIEVYDYNRVAGDSFQVYFNEQRPGFVVPYTGDIHPSPGYTALGAPARGLTNQQAWGLYGLAIAGAVAPADAPTRAGIDGGLIGPLTDSHGSPPPAPGSSPSTPPLTQPVRPGLVSLVPAAGKILQAYDYNQQGAGDAGSPGSSPGRSADEPGPGPRVSSQADTRGTPGPAPVVTAGPEKGWHGQRDRWDSDGLAFDDRGADRPARAGFALAGDLLIGA
jgi:hypothetical protein